MNKSEIHTKFEELASSFPLVNINDNNISYEDNLPNKLFINDIRLIYMCKHSDFKDNFFKLQKYYTDYCIMCDTSDGEYDKDKYILHCFVLLSREMLFSKTEKQKNKFFKTNIVKTSFDPIIYLQKMYIMSLIDTICEKYSGKRKISIVTRDEYTSKEKNELAKIKEHIENNNCFPEPPNNEHQELYETTKRIYEFCNKVFENVVIITKEVLSMYVYIIKYICRIDDIRLLTEDELNSLGYEIDGKREEIHINKPLFLYQD